MTDLTNVAITVPPSASVLALEAGDSCTVSLFQGYFQIRLNHSTVDLLFFELAASCALLIWDIILTFDQEIEVIWRSA